MTYAVIYLVVGLIAVLALGVVIHLSSKCLRSGKAKRWWQKSPGDFVFELFEREETRWIGAVLFAATIAFGNWVVVHAVLKGESMDNLGLWVRAKSQPVAYSIWATQDIVLAVAGDAVLIGAILFVYRESRKRPNKSRETTRDK